MRRDIRGESLFREAERLYQTYRRPGSGLISDAAHVSTNGRQIVFAATQVEALIGEPASRIALTEIDNGDTRVLTFGPNSDRYPKFSPNGETVAFLSDRHEAGDFQLYLLDLASGAAKPAPPVEGWVEYLHWSPDGRRILLGVAGHGADVSSGQGAIASQQLASDTPAWMPAVETGDESYRWRRAWVYDLETDQVLPVGPAKVNVWESVWCGNDKLAAVVSSSPSEGFWYGAHLALIDVDGDQCRDIYRAEAQLGWPAASPSGKRVVVVEALCSDRGVVAGDLCLIDIESGAVRRIDTAGVDITHAEWRSERHVLLAGHRGFETVVSLYDVGSSALTENWRSTETTGSGLYIAVVGIGESGDCAFVCEGFQRAPEIAVIRNGKYRTVRAFDAGYAKATAGLFAIEQVTWNAPDGLEIQGWLLRPQGAGPFPVIMNVHGGPIYHWRPLWLIRPRMLPSLMLLSRGYAVFFPNPRGSSGRGQGFVRHVVGDMGGADTHDYLSGLDHLVKRGIADPTRLGVKGVSYGGYMSSWLITQDTRFAAAVPVAPVTNWVTEHLISNIPHFVTLCLGDTYRNADGKYFDRSPIMHAHKVRTPTLSICGALDRCTPPEEAVQFHNALLENQVKSVLVTYPHEGHGVRKWPAAIDYAARLTSWFLDHMPAGIAVP